MKKYPNPFIELERKLSDIIISQFDLTNCPNCIQVVAENPKTHKKIALYLKRRTQKCKWKINNASLQYLISIIDTLDLFSNQDVIKAFQMAEYKVMSMYIDMQDMKIFSINKSYRTLYTKINIVDKSKIQYYQICWACHAELMEKDIQLNYPYNVSFILAFYRIFSFSSTKTITIHDQTQKVKQFINLVKD